MLRLLEKHDDFNHYPRSKEKEVRKKTVLKAKRKEERTNERKNEGERNT